MIDLSPAGLAGAVIGTAIAALIYGRLAALVERSLLTRERSQSSGDAEPIERALLLRAVLATDIIVFAGIGYWLGIVIAG
jgi:uncharacterized protein involved in cysteine biosynthesis